MIELRGVRVHNLKEIDLDLPCGEVIAFCGRSGSGKSSLAVDTLLTEGQRRYIESFSPAARRFLEQWEKPDADRLDGIPAAISVADKALNPSSRSTVGDATEIDDYLRLLFAKIGTIFCPKCGEPVKVDTPQSILEELKSFAAKKIQIAFAPPLDASQKTFEKTWKEHGFVRGILDGESFKLDEEFKSCLTSCDLWSQSPAESLFDAVEQGSHPRLLLIVDRIVIGQTDDKRIVDSLETALKYGNGRCFVLESTNHVFSSRLTCEHCGIPFEPLEPKFFRENETLIKSRGSEIKSRGCKPPDGLSNEHSPSDNERFSKLHLSGGLHPRLLRNAVRIDDKNIDEIRRLKIAETTSFFEKLKLSESQQFVGKTPLDGIRRRLAFLEEVGLDYLTLSRPTRTLSSGELRRVALTSVLGSTLVDMLYVLDEPSVGLHPKDTEILLRAIRSLRDRGNSVVLVEHDEDLLLAADRVVEIGPEAGENGGRIIFQGTPNEMLAAPDSPTGSFLSENKLGVPRVSPRRAEKHGFLELHGATGNNLQNIDVSFPLGMLCLVTGVSGAGKSSLVQETLYPALCKTLGKKTDDGLPYETLLGADRLDDVILVDRTPIGRSGRSNPVTYLKIFDEIRNVFAETVDARTRNYSAGFFSFNVDGGRCETCKGDGSVTVDMQFLPDMFLPCPQCKGRRYRSEILDVTYRGKNIAEVLDLTAREAFGFFRGQAKIQQKLKRLMDVGLDYLRLGQPANTLSGGESQRLKLAAFLSTIKKGRCLFLFDEPTTGLHFADIVQLLDCFDALLATGHSLIVVEHNVQMMRAADYLIDLGPGAADVGGRIVAFGTPEKVAATSESVTGRFLA